MSHSVPIQEVYLTKNVTNPKHRVISLYAAVYLYFFLPLVYTSCYNNEGIIFEGSVAKY